MVRHESQRGYFAFSLFEEMKKNKNIFLICADLGYKVFDAHFERFPSRCINTGAAEVCAIDISIGLALSGKIPFVYSITPFLLYRPFESLRTYINYENISVKLIASGRENDYEHDGFSHYAGDDKDFLTPLTRIKTFWPDKKEDIPSLVKQSLQDASPYYINLTR